MNADSIQRKGASRRGNQRVERDTNFTNLREAKLTCPNGAKALELFGKQRKEFGEAEGPQGLSEWE